MKSHWIMLLAVVFCGGCVRWPPPLVILVIDTNTGKTVARIKDASRDVPGPWGMHDSETILPGRISDETFHTLYDDGKGWRIREFDASGHQVGTRSVPRLVGHYMMQKFAFDPDFERAVYARPGLPWAVCVRNLQTDEEACFLEGALTSELSVGALSWLDKDTVLVMVKTRDDGPYRGTVLTIPLSEGSPTILFKSPDLCDVTPSPDGQQFVARLLSRTMEGDTRYWVVNATSGDTQEVVSVPRMAKEEFLSAACWSPEEDTLAYGRGASVFIYDLHNSQARLLAKAGGDVASVIDIESLGFLDGGRLFCHWEDRETFGGKLEILDTAIGTVLASRRIDAGNNVRVFSNGARIAVEAEKR